ncbi:MAG: aminopeptidase P family N-terminal domain-containing protein [Clostridiales bacterium]|jgi:Xaa-Pro aminopeptidase|nr:aminopeptidase P family N-terminal domain-containing protein [Clostridiales bacterium]
MNDITYLKTPEEEILRRIRRLQVGLQAYNIKAAIIVQKADLFYFSGTCQNAHLFVPKEGEPYLFVKKSFSRAEKESTIKNINPLRNLHEFFGFLNSHVRDSDIIGMELDILPTNLYLKYKEMVSPNKIVDISKIIREIRIQ